MSDIINPFKQVKKTDWAKKTQERLKNSQVSNQVNTQINQEEKKEEVKIEVPKVIEKKGKKKVPERTAKSFKIYPGKISRNFDKRVNKLQVHFDDKDFEKNYVDAGKYMMFLMEFAEKFQVYELYKEVNVNGELDLDLQTIKNFFSKK